jgi:valyl-tRNA synthetase
MRVLVPLAGLIDVATEIERLQKQLARSQKDLHSVERKLDNRSFIANAPDDIVARERARREEINQQTGRLQAQLTRLRELE